MVVDEGAYLAAVREHAPATTRAVAEAVGVTRQGADYRLRRLESEGKVAGEMIGNSLVWRVTAEESPEPDAPGVTPDESDGGHDAPESAESDALRAAVESVADGWDDSAERIEARKAAARAVLDYAREHGGVSKQEAKEQVYPEYPVADQNPRTWYRKNVRPVLNEVAEYDQSARKYKLTE